MKRIDESALHEWPADTAWSRILPEWFVAEFAPEMSQETAEAELARRKCLSPEEQNEAAEGSWSLLNWIYWFQPENRKWFWWDAQERDANVILIAAEVAEWPFPWGSLKWLFRAAGAARVDAEL